MRHLKHCTFYTDAWRVFAEALPRRRRVVGKAHTVAIERDSSNTHHHLARLTRRTKVVSKKRGMVDLTLRLWRMLTSEPWFTKHRTVALSIYK